MSFRLKATLIIALVEILILFGLVGTSLYFMHESNDSASWEYVNANGEELALLVREAVLFSDLAVLEEVADNFMEHPDNLYLRIRDNEKLLVERNREGVQVVQSNPDVSLADVNDGVFDLQKIIRMDDYPVGVIEVGFNVDAYYDFMDNAMQGLILIAIFGFITVTALAWFFGALITRELNVLRLGLNQVGRGEVDLQLHVRSSGEFRELAQAFNLMSESLDLRQRERDKAEANLVIARETAEKANQVKSEFLAHITHEIRSPLNALMGCVELLGESELNESQRIFTDSAQQSAANLLLLINDFLDFTRIESGALELADEAFDIREICESVLDSKALQIAGRPIELSMVVDPRLPGKFRGDSGRIRQILVNLVDNATKFTKQGGVNIEVSASPQGDMKYLLRCAVSDSGIGIPLARQASIFEAFTQVDSTDATLHGGAGLGLSICYRLVQAMAGTIELTSSPDSGATFNVEVPLEAVETGVTPLIPEVELAVISNNAFFASALDRQFNALGQASRFYTAISDLEQRLGSLQWVFIDASIDISIDNLSLLESLRKANTQLVIMLGRKQIAENPNPSIQAFDFVIEKPVKLRKILELLNSSAMEPVEVATDKLSLKTKLRRKGHILLAEDSPANQLVAVAMLESAGYQVSVASNGLEVIQLVEETEFDLVLMDVRMPTMDGIEATRRIRASAGSCAEIPIIALTANVGQNEVERCLAVGMNGIIGKPASKITLLDSIDKYHGSQDNEEEVTIMPNLILKDNGILERLATETSEAMLERMINMFVPETLKRVDSMQENWEVGDLSSLQDEAHTLKSNAATFGASHLSTLARDIESACKRQDKLRVAELLPEIVAITRETLSLYSQQFNITQSA